jgi:excisionase family DNA binding protein
MTNPFDEINSQLQVILDRLSYISSISPPHLIEIITQEELCKRLVLSKPTIIRWVKKGKIPEMRIGNSLRYNWYSVIDALENNNKNKKN